MSSILLFKVRQIFIIPALILSACSQNVSDASAPRLADADAPSAGELDAPLIEAPALIELDMLNEADGWGVSEAEIVRTTDGGVTWYNVTPPELKETGYTVDSFILDNDHVWIQKPDLEHFPNSGFLYRTIDGGITWWEYVAPFSGGDFHFLDEENGWALADLGAATGSNAVAVFQTTDGGETWQMTYTNDPNHEGAGDSLPLSGNKSTLVPLDMNTAWVGGVVYAPGEVYLYRTEDGGRSWSPVPLTLSEGAENFELGVDDEQMKFVSRREGFLALRMAGDSTQTAVYITNDSGSSWTLTPTILDGAGASEFLSAEEAVIYNGEQFHVTRDAAVTWSAISPDVVFGESFANLEFANLNTGWVITVDPTTNHRSLYKTTDGGTTWFPVIP